MIYLNPSSLRDLVGLNSSGDDVKSKKDTEKDILKVLTEFRENPPAVTVKMFDLLDVGPEGTDRETERVAFLKLMSDPKLDLVDLEFDMHVEGEMEDKQLYYTAVVTYRYLPVIGPKIDYQIHDFMLPFKAEAYSTFLSSLDKEVLATEGEKQYIKRSSVVRKDRTYGKRGAILYYYHTITTYKEVGPTVGNDSIPTTDKAFGN